MDARLLAMDRHTLRLGLGALGFAATSCCRLGGRSLGATRRRLGLGAWSLALSPRLVCKSDLHRASLKAYLRRDA